MQIVYEENLIKIERKKFSLSKIRILFYWDDIDFLMDSTTYIIKV